MITLLQLNKTPRGAEDLNKGQMTGLPTVTIAIQVRIQRLLPHSFPRATSSTTLRPGSRAVTLTAERIVWMADRLHNGERRAVADFSVSIRSVV